MNLETFTCGAFWLSNSITSTIMGIGNRSQQEINAEENQLFQIELENLRAEFQDNAEKEKAARMRARMAVLRNHRLKEAAMSHEVQLNSIQIQEFVKHYFPIYPAYLFTLIEDAKKDIGKYYVRPNVILLHTLQTSLDYHIIEEKIGVFCKEIRDVNFRQEYCMKDVGGNSTLLNLHAVLGSTPTIVISPYYIKDVIYVNAAIWEPQSLQPYIKPIFSFNCERNRLRNNDLEYKKQIEDKLVTVASLFTAVARDSYMAITYGKEPLLDKLLQMEKFSYIKSSLSDKEFKPLLEFLKREYLGTAKLISERMLPNLLQVYSAKDIDSIGEDLALIGSKLPDKSI